VGVKKLFYQIIAATAGLWLASYFVPKVKVAVLPSSSFFGINITETWQIFLVLGIILGLLNFFIKPILDVITLPLRIITLGLFGFVINGVLIWALDVMFEEFSAPWLMPLLWTTLTIWALNIVLLMIFKKNK